MRENSALQAATHPRRSPRPGAPCRRRRAGRFLLWGLAGLLATSCAHAPRQAAPELPAPAAPPTAPPPGVPPSFTAGGEPLLDIGLAWDLDSLTVAPTARTPVSTAAASRETRLGETGAAIHVRLIRSGWEIAWKKGDATALVTSLWPRDTLWIGFDPHAGAAEPGGENPIQWRGASWRGRLKIFVNPRGKLTLATRLPLETYLLGVVPGEIGNLAQDVVEAGRAQAIAARSYTLYYRGRRESEGFDLYGTVEDQVYGPIEDERPMASRCVASTRGEVELWGGRPIRANYSANCGGISADVWEAWPADPVPYLVSRADRAAGHDYCETSPNYRWREEWTPEEFLSDLSRYGREQGVRLPQGGLGSLVDVRVESRSPSGRVWRLVVETTSGQVVVPAYSLRRVLRRSGQPDRILRSNLFKIDVRRDPASRRALAVVASGAGSGHGVGLCQTGAIGMAKSGLVASSILVHYYPGTDLRRLYQ